jgi:LysM repeat protein
MNKNKRPSLLNMVQKERDRERLHMAATVTEEAEWHREESNGGLARMFVVMLLIHIVVIGGIIVYDFVGDPNKGKPVTATPTVLPTTAKPAALASNTAATATKPIAAIPVQLHSTTPVAAAPSAPSASATFSVPTAPVQTAAVTTPKVISLTEEPLPASSLPAAVINQKPASMKVEQQPEVKPVVVKEEAPAPRAAVVAEQITRPIMTPREAERALQEDEDAAKGKPVMRNKETAPKKVEPAKKTVATKKAEPKPTVRSKPRGHVIGKGDTIYRLAKKYGVSEKSILSANGIKNPSALRIGKALTIPAK